MCYYSTDSDFKICLRAQKVSGPFEKQAPVHFGLKLKLARLAFNLLGDGPPKQRIQEKSKLLIQITMEAISIQPCHLTIPTHPWHPHTTPLWCTQSPWSQCMLDMLLGLFLHWATVLSIMDWSMVHFIVRGKFNERERFFNWIQGKFSTVMWLKSWHFKV